MRIDVLQDFEYFFGRSLYDLDFRHFLRLGGRQEALGQEQADEVGRSLIGVGIKGTAGLEISSGLRIGEVTRDTTVSNELPIHATPPHFLLKRSNLRQWDFRVVRADQDEEGGPHVLVIPLNPAT